MEIDGTLFLSSVRGVTGNYYGDLGAASLLGRLIAPTDAANFPGASVAVIGYEFWQERFGGDPTVIGKTIRIEGEPFTIIGVSRRWFTGMTPGRGAQRQSDYRNHGDGGIPHQHAQAKTDVLN